MKIIKFLFLFVAVVGLIAYASKPSDEKCIKLGKDFASGFLAKTPPITDSKANTSSPSSSESITVEDNYFYKSIYYSENGKILRIGYAYFGNVRLSHTTRGRALADHPVDMHPMLIIFSL